MRSGLPVVTLHRPHFEEELAGFKVLVLANVALMSDAQAEAVRRFVRDGGGLIATHETSLFDEKGRRRADFALADVLGVHYQNTLPAASRPMMIARQAIRWPPVCPRIRRWHMTNRWWPWRWPALSRPVCLPGTSRRC